MKKKNTSLWMKLLSVTGAVLFAASTYAQYCTPAYTTGTVEGDYCSYVGLGAIANSTGAAPSPFYSDYTAMNADLTAGTAYTITLGAGSYTSGNDLAAWIDYNQDGDFGDAGELVGTVLDLTAFATGSATFTVPLTALNGATRMRVREIWGMPATPDPCATYSFGETEDYTVTISGGGGGGATGTAYYVYSNVFGGSEPWFTTNNTTAMNTAFGPEGTGWTRAYFETVDVGTLFSDATCFVFLEGSDFCADELESFLTANIGTIESWVSGGGHLLLNAAPNEGDGMSFGFDGTSLVYSYFTSSVSGVGGHPIFSGPYTPAGTSYTGTSFGHARITGTGLTSVIVDAFAVSNVVLAEKAWGSGDVMFGGMTTDNWHDPDPNAANLRANILAYLGTCATECPAPGGLTASDITGSSATLSWDAVEGATGYHLSVYQTDQTLVLKKKVLGGATSWTVTGLTPGTDYAFHVRTFCTGIGLVSPISYNYYFSTPFRIGDQFNNISMYPNPNNGEFSLSLNGYENNTFDLSVINSLGQIVYNTSVQINQSDFIEEIQLENAAPGMYQIKLTNNEHDLNYSFMISE